MSKAFGLAQLGNVFDDGALSNRNMVANGAMTVAQRGTSATGISSTNGYFTVDRLRVVAGAGTWTMTQESHSDGPDGHRFSAKMAVTSTAAIGSGTASVRFDYFSEAQDCVHLNYGQSDAKTVTLSFWVKGSTTGTYAIALYGNDAARVIGSTYTVDVVDTWEYKTVTFEGDVSGSINADNGKGIEISWFLSAGSGLTSTDNTSWAAYSTTNYAFGHGVDLANTASGYLQITGVQLECSDTATPFEHRSYGDELARCQRYYYSNTSTSQFYATQYVDTYKFVQWGHPVRMRATPTPTVTYFTGSFSPYQIDDQHFKAYVASSYTDGTTYYTTSYAMDAEL
jgi:hypothetical protein